MADTVGNTLGRRGTFQYTTDDGEVFNFSQDDSVGKAVGNVVPTVSRRPVPINTGYLEARYILVIARDDIRVKKKIYIGSPANPLMTAAASSIITINARQFAVTGRVGEKASFLQLTQPAPPPD